MTAPFLSEIENWLLAIGGRDQLVNALKRAKPSHSLENIRANLRETLLRGQLRPKWWLVCERLGGAEHPPDPRWFGMESEEESEDGDQAAA